MKCVTALASAVLPTATPDSPGNVIQAAVGWKAATPADPDSPGLKGGNDSPKLPAQPLPASALTTMPGATPPAPKHLPTLASLQPLRSGPAESRGPSVFLKGCLSSGFLLGSPNPTPFRPNLEERPLEATLLMESGSFHRSR